MGNGSAPLQIGEGLQALLTVCVPCGMHALCCLEALAPQGFFHADQCACGDANSLGTVPKAAPRYSQISLKELFFLGGG